MIPEHLNLGTMNNFLPLLAIETSDSICGACIYFDESKYFSSKILLKHSHSEKLFELINTVLEQAELKMVDVKLISVSSGPGSFTGLRIGMAAAKGIAEPLNLPILPVPTFEALALHISNFLETGSHFIIINPVGKDELYFGKFHVKSNNHIFQEELKIIPNNDFVSLSEGLKVFGKVNVKNDLIQNGIINISSPDPEYIAKWSVIYGDGKVLNDFDFLEPNYLKEFIVKEKKL